MSTESVRITLVRHGESLANLSQRWQGQGDSPLSELGRAQALAVARRLGARTFDRIIASDLQRASDTARALARPFERDVRFREFDIGAWEGLTREDVAVRFAGELARLEAGEDVPLGGGESYALFCARIDEALARVRSELSPGEHALVVCHGGVIGALVSGALGLRKERALPIGRVFNTAITELSYDADGRATLHVFNDSLHLSELALFPHPADMTSALGLVCGEAPHAAFGAFEAQYEAARHLAELLGEEQGLVSLLMSIRSRHPGRRVALSAAAGAIHGWVRELLWRKLEPAAELMQPPVGSLCHVSTLEGRVALLDYGVAR